MKAVVFERFGEAPRIQTVPDPKPAADGVVIKVEATGLCRSDWHGWMGHDDGITLPHVPGHELAGIVVAVGKRVTRWKAGERVTVPFCVGCGRCFECNSGNHQVCEHQTQPFVTSFRAIVDQGRVTPGEWVAVHGCGGVGLSAIMIASSMGANVIAIDLTDEKLDFARKIGAVATINASTTPNVVKAIKQITNGGAHMSMDALGHPTTSFNSIANLRRRGRHVQVGLMLGEHARPQVPMDKVIAFELEILGSHGMQAHRYPAMMEMIRTGKLKPELLVGKKISLDEAPAALVAMGGFEGIGIGVVTKF
ncbi:zinc-dependent alcohol dehydrogenase family protein [Mesorhizobium sp. LSJC264A00]|uniref:zinc-dependent alcohol dehydrogenase family protein n=1 Tax=Mesorhizobium sp. LSJC264A00 TaxID=1287321 RepID=UPI0003CE564D|nr:zinc-dependent alcohol dehydrogenase family protein [Mesorhizobium sp. LSJC264A00]ESX21371.1 alcohol dehydrogenase [Mesorhizobium sp. LSJC264A00]